MIEFKPSQCRRLMSTTCMFKESLDIAKSSLQSGHFIQRKQWKLAAPRWYSHVYTMLKKSLEGTYIVLIFCPGLSMSHRGWTLRLWG